MDSRCQKFLGEICNALRWGELLFGLQLCRHICKTRQSAFSLFIWTHTQWVMINPLKTMVKVNCSRHRPGVAQRVGIGIALLFHDRGTRMGWVVSSTPRPHFTPGKNPVPILQEDEWAPGPIRLGGKSRPHRDSIPDRPARSQSLYRLSYPAHLKTTTNLNFI